MSDLASQQEGKAQQERKILGANTTASFLIFLKN